MSQSFIRQVLLVAALVSAGAVQAEPVADSTLARQEMIRILKERHFTGSVLVTERAHVILEQAFGLANAEWQIPNSPDTKFRIGSLTKQFTAAAILILEERLKLSVADSIRMHLPDLPPSWEGITIFHLLTHTSGIANFTDLPDYPTIKTVAMGSTRIVALVRDRPLDFKAGEQFRYSNTGYVILGRIIESVSGQSYAAFLQANIFEPLGMKDTGYDYSAHILPKRAEGYSLATGSLMHAPYIDMAVPHSAGALYSTTRDLNRWQQQLHAGRLLSPASLQKMTTAYKERYGFGVSIVAQGGTKSIDHGGGIDGFRAFMSYKLPAQLGIVVLSNLEEGPAEEIAIKLASIAKGRPPYARVPIFLRGTMNEWGLVHRLLPVGPDLFAVLVAMPAGTHELKVASEDFSTVDFGGSSSSRTLSSRQSHRLEVVGANVVLQVDHPGTFNFTLNVRQPFSPTLMVSPSD
jgi:CubicO group peptidase (beta-lactamase class C family)